MHLKLSLLTLASFTISIATLPLYSQSQHLNEPAAMPTMTSPSTAQPPAANNPEISVNTLHKDKVYGPDQQQDLLKSNADGSLTLQGTGRDAYMGKDEGSFAWINADDSDFTFTVYIKSASGQSANYKYGISMRESLDPHAKAVNVRYDAYKENKCIQWFMRYRVAKNAHQGHRVAFRDGLAKQLKAKEGFYLKLVRHYPYVSAYFSLDGEKWEDVAPDYNMVFLPQEFYIGVHVTNGGHGNQAASTTFEKFTYTPHQTLVPAQGRADFKQSETPRRTWRYVMISDKDSKGMPLNMFVMLPKDLDPKKLRALHWTAGSKELMYQGGLMPYTKGPIKKAKQRKPTPMPIAEDAWEGVWEYEDANPYSEMLYSHGVIHLGGANPSPQYIDIKRIQKKLAELSGVPEIEHLPIVATGDSFAGGQSSHIHRLWTDRVVAAAPVMIGNAGFKAAEEEEFATPLYYVWGTIDGGRGGHHKTMNETIPQLIDKKSVWSAAPQWWVAHWHCRADAVIWPYFLDLIEARVPQGHDFSEGPATLLPVNYEDGWYGITDGWPTNKQPIISVKDFQGETKNRVWFPNEKHARNWQAYSSEKSKTVIHFPQFEGGGNPLFPPPNGWKNTVMKAGEDFRLLASGPVAEDLKVKYFIDGKEVKPVKIHSGPFDVTLPAQAAGIHLIHLETSFNGKEEVSRPVMNYFRP